MNSDSTKQIIDALRPVADKLGQGASHLYAIYVRQAYNDAIASFMWFVLFCGVLATLGVLAKKQGEYWDDEWVFWSVGIVIFVPLAGVALGSGIQHLVNPEYYAIHNIVCDAKGGC